MVTETKVEPKALILHHLKRGECNAIKKKHLAQLCDMNERAMRQTLLQLLTEDGQPICGNPHPPYGYFIAANTDEIKSEMEIIRSYGKELFRRYWALRKCKRKMEIPLPVVDNGQIRML